MTVDNSLSVHPDTQWDMFRNLSEKEETRFRSQARKYFNGKTGKVFSIWHPVYQDECYRIITEYLKRCSR